MGSSRSRKSRAMPPGVKRGKAVAAGADPAGRREPAAAPPDAGAQRAAPLQPALNLLPYQRRWVADSAPLKLVVKARQIGYSFAATLHAVLQCLEKKTTWIFLSKGERQSRLLMEKVQEHVQSCGIVAQACESTFFEGTLIKQLEVRFANGSVIYGLPANPDTARGYTGHVTLDEFAFHTDADKIYASLYPTITRGFSLEVISTPNGQQGKFYELAKAAGLVDGVGADLRVRPGQAQGPAPTSWSAHWCDVYEAARQGLKIDLNLLRAGCDDETTWQQEYCCQFVSTAENFFPPELLAACLSAEASTDMPFLLPPGIGSAHLLASAPGLLLEGSRQSAVGSRESAAAGDFSIPKSKSENPKSGEFYLGIDIGRHHDRTVFWLDEVFPSPLAPRPEGEGRKLNTSYPLPEGEGGPQGRVRDGLSITRMVRTLANVPFAEQLDFARELLLHADVGAIRESPLLIRRACIDATGIGAPLAEALVREFGPRVEPVVFTAAVKEDLAYRTKRRLENRLSLLPDTREIRRAFSVVKKIVTLSGNLRFDAARTEAGHADEFWAKALADLAADSQPTARASDGFLAPGAPLIQPGAFEVTDTAWTELETL